MTKNTTILSIVLLLLLIGRATSFAQPCYFSDYRFNSISTNEGLLQSSVLSMVQDKNGYIWMGTKYGLSKYDGYKIKSYQHIAKDTNSICASEIINLLIDKNDDILIGTRGGGLSKYLSKQDVFKVMKGIPNNAIVNLIYEDADSVLWIGSNKGFFKGKYSQQTFEYHFKNINNESIFKDANGTMIAPDKLTLSTVSLLEINQHFLLLGTENGIFTYNKNEGIFAEIDIENINDAKITSLLKDSSGKIYIGSSKGVVIIDSLNKKNNIVTLYNDEQKADKKLKIIWVNQLVLDSDNNLWGGTRGGGLFEIQKNGQLINFTSNNNQGYISDNIINSLLIDNTGVLWIGTESRGCNLLDLYRKKFKHIEIDYPTGRANLNNQITAITGDTKNTLWVGTAFNGISKIEKKPNGNYFNTSIDQITSLNNTPLDEIIALHADKNNNLWIGTANNTLTKLAPNNIATQIETNGFVFAIHEDKNNDIWYGTWGNGFGLVNQQDYSVLTFSSENNGYKGLVNDLVLSFEDDAYNNLWIGTRGGGINIASMALLKLGEGRFVNYMNNPNDSTSISNNDINCIYEANNGTLWIGTANGLNQVVFPTNSNKNQAILQGKLKFKVFNESNGLPSNVICGLLEDADGNLWISTINGLSKFDPKSQEFINFSVNDGLQANEFRANVMYKPNDDALFFGGINGITAFNPKQIEQGKSLANIVITAFKISDLDVEPNKAIKGDIILNENITDTKKIVLKAKHKEFGFEFSGMHFSNIAKVKYAYRLIGFNDEWRIIKGNTHAVNYTNILEGNYIFQVKATNNDGVWNDDFAEMHLTILPPFWKHPIFFFLYFLMIAVLLLFFRKYSLIAITEKNKLKIESLERNKIIELTESKMRFLTNVSHEIRTPLTLIYSPLEKIIQNNTLDAETKLSFNLIHKNVKRLLSLTNQLLQLRKIDNGILEPSFESIEIKAFIQDVLEYFKQQATQKNINLSFNNQYNESENTMWVDKEMLTTILFNLLSNSFKYINKKATIEVTLSELSKDAIPQFKNSKAHQKINTFLLIQVSDNGLGIPPDDLNKIFHRFYQSKGSGKTEYGGSGIGLSIVKEYINLHSGMVKPHSEVGKGTTMNVYLPLGNKHIPKNQIKTSTEHIGEYYQAKMQPLEHSHDYANNKKSEEIQTIDTPLILLVDDDIDMLALLSNHLQQKYRIKTAENGNEAWQCIKNEQPKLVISDIMMPELDGNELCDLIKSNVETSHIPIILLSAKAANENVIEGYEKGADRYISKPFSLFVLEAQVAQLLTTRKQLINLYSQKILLKPHDIAITSTDEKFMTKIIDVIEDNMSDPHFDVAQMVKEMNMSHSAVLKKIKALTDSSLVDFMRRHRLNKAALIFEKNKIPVSEVAYMVGFSDPKYFSKCFSKQFGVTPSEYLANPVIHE